MTKADLQAVLREAETFALREQLADAVEGLEQFGDEVELLFALSRTYYLFGKQDQAKRFALQVLEIDPKHLRAIVQLGWIARVCNELDEARERFEAALEFGLEDWQLHNHLGLLSLVARRLGSAERHFSQALELGCPETSVLCNFANVLMLGGRSDEALILLGPMLESLPDDMSTLQATATCLNYADVPTPQEVFEMHRRFGAAVQARSPQGEAPQDISRDPERRLRIGYLSADLRTHSVAYFLLPMIEHHNRQEVEVVLYSVGKEDEVTQRFRDQADLWRSGFQLSDDQLTEQIREDRIDILVELGGLFEGHRLGVMARRVAPVQVTYCGYPNTTGLDTIDYRMVDSLTDPPGAEHLATESLVRLDPCFLGYRPLESVRPTKRNSRSPNQPIAFGSFNNLTKISPALIEAWCEILKRVPRSRLLLKSGMLDEPIVRDRLAEEFVRRGIERHRLRMLAFTETLEEHLALYGQVDIALDTFPYHGTTTTCEALSMGVPVA